LIDNIRYTASHAAVPPLRSAMPSLENPAWLRNTLSYPVQVVPVYGSAPRQNAAMAAQTVRAIRSLVGRTIAIPNGELWKTITIEYHHCAVIVEKHALAEPFMQAFGQAGIPYAKYKMQGIFQSDMARHFRALLKVIDNPAESPSLRSSVLMTSFFNVHPMDISSDTDSPAENMLAQCLLHWIPLARNRLWSQLFRSIIVHTHVRERLLFLTDGDRQLADLRQIMEYTQKVLLSTNQSLSHIVEHLKNLDDKTEKTDGDENLFIKESSKSAVQILTMHTAKGLEFPVVFLMTGGSNYTSRKILRWIDDANHVHVLPALSLESTYRSTIPEIDAAYNEARDKARQERRRLLYVALTRSQALLFVPLKTKQEPVLPAVTWAVEDINRFTGDTDLTPLLIETLSNAEEDFPVAMFSPSDESWIPVPHSLLAPIVDNLQDLPLNTDDKNDAKAAAMQARSLLKKLGLTFRAHYQTSYSELSRNSESERDIDKAHEPEYVADVTIESLPLPPTALPRSRHTGNALHEVYEYCLRQSSLAWADKDGTIPDDIRDCMASRLAQNGVLSSLNEHQSQAAIDTALTIIKRSFMCPLSLPGGGSILLKDVSLVNRLAETEFHAGVGCDWVFGYMDLVFSVDNRYYILDWKSNSLPEFTLESIGASIEQAHYSLQAKVYCHALHQFLQGIMGAQYDPQKHCGGAVYVYLRAFEYGTSVPVWTHQAHPENDRIFTESVVNAFTGRKEQTCQ
jgi:exodeoxyribonuclease V beta subunit